jgi:DNA polymerase-3 subunit alpha
LFDFVTRVDNKFVNKKVLEALISVGAFDSLNEANRATLFNAIDLAVNFAKQKQEKTNGGMDSLFTGEVQEQTVIKPKLEQIEEWSDNEKLTKEKELLDFYVSGSPLDKYKNFIKTLATINSSDVFSPLVKTDGNNYYNGNGNRESQAMARVCGIVENILYKLSRKNKKFAIAKLTDFEGNIELLFGQKFFDSSGQLENQSDKNILSIEDGDIVLCIGTAYLEQDGSMKVIAQEYYNIFDAIDKFSRGFEIKIDLKSHTADDFKKFSELCTGIGNKKDFHFVIVDEDKKETRKYVSEDLDFPVTEYSVNSLLNIFGSDNVRLIKTL